MNPGPPRGSRRGIAIVLLLAALAAWATWSVVRLRGEARLARLGADTLAAGLERLTEDAQVEALAGGQPVILRIEAFRAEERLDAGEFAAARAEETRLRLRIGAAWRVIGEWSRALARLEQAERAALEHQAEARTIWDELVIRTTPPDPGTVLDTREELARAWLEHGDAIRALALAPSGPRARSLLLVGEILGDLGDAEGERSFTREAIRHAPASDAALAFVRSDALARLASIDGQLSLRREALDALRPFASEEDPRVARRMYELASELDDRGPLDAEEARSTYDRALHARLATACGDFRALATHLNNYGRLLKRMGRLQEAEPLLVRALEMRRRLVPGDDRATATMTNNLGTLMHALGQLEAAGELLSTALAMRQRLFPSGHSDVAQSLQNLAWLRQEQGKFAEAVDLARTAVLILRKVSDEEDLDLAIAIDNLGSALVDLGDHAEAERRTREALAIEERWIAGDDPNLAQTLDNLGVILYRRRGDLAEAERHLTAALAMRRALYGDGHVEVAETVKHLAWLHERAEDYPRAERRYREAIELRRTSAPDPEVLVGLQNDLADCLFASGDPGRGVDVYREALATAIASLPGSAEAFAIAAEGLVISAERSRRHAEAEADLVAAGELAYRSGTIPAHERERVVEALWVFYDGWSEYPEHEERARNESKSWSARLHEIRTR